MPRGVYSRSNFVQSPKQRAQIVALGKSRRTHGLRHTSEYGTWNQMKMRCLNPNAAAYKEYGGRGITICQRWVNSFENFLKDMGRRPSGRNGKRPAYTLERRENNGPYCKENCEWATWRAQAINRRETEKVKASRLQNLRKANKFIAADNCDC